MAKRVLDVDRALDVIVQHLRGSLSAGKEFSGVVSPYGEDVDVEISIRVKPHVSLRQTARWRANAMALLAAEGWRDRCPHTVRSRGRSFSPTTSCSGKVTAAIVYRAHEWEEGPMRPDENRRFMPAERIHFACAHHEDVNDQDVLGVVRLEKNALRLIRVERERTEAERAARARAKERELEAEVKTYSDGDLRARFNEAVAAHQWGLEDICDREMRRRRAKGDAA